MEYPSECELKTIKQLWVSKDPNDNELALQWLTKLIGEASAKANLYLSEFYKNGDDDGDLVFDENNYFKMVFQTSKRGRNGDYYYHVHFDVKIQGEQIVDQTNDYSRSRVADGQPKFDLGVLINEQLTKRGYNLYFTMLNPLK